MKNSLWIKSLTVMILSLVIMLPVSSSFIIASSVRYSEVYGQNMVRGMSKGYDDPLTFKVQITADSGNEISTDEVSINFPAYQSSIIFSDDFCTSSCTKETDPSFPSNTYTCVCESDWSLSEPLDIVFNYDEGKDGSVDATGSAYIYPDVKPPEIVVLSAVQENGHIKVQYEVQDSACQACQGKCSGIKDMEVSDSSGPIALDDINTTYCSYEGNFNFNYSNEGNNSLLFLTKDMVWSSDSDDYYHAYSKLLKIYTDFSSPTISSQLSVQKDGEELSFISDNDMVADIVFKINDAKLDRISAKLSAIGNNPDINNAGQVSYCTREGDEYTCKVRNQKIAGGTTSLSLNITAIDIMGNTATAAASKTFTLDNIKSVVEFIGSSRFFDDKSYLKKENNTIIVKVEESGSGLSAEELYLNMNSIGQQTSMKTDNCTKSGNGWTCLWQDIDVVGRPDNSNYPITRVGTSHDDAGNPLEGLESSILFYDSKDPSIMNITMAGIGEMGQRFYFQSDDIIMVNLEADSLGGSPIVEAYADFSDIYTINASSVAGECTGSNVSPTRYNCTWQTDAIKAGYYTADITFTVTDAAGNSISQTKKIAVYGVSSGTPDNYDLMVGNDIMVPRSINRLTASLLPNPPGYKILVPFKLTGGGNNVEALSYDISSCTIGGDEAVYKQMFSDDNNPTKDPVPMLLDVTQEGEDNYAEFILAKFSGDELRDTNSFDVNCTVSIYQRIGNYVYSEPEKETMFMHFNVSGSALSNTPGDEIIEKINKERDGLVKDTKFITEGVKIINTLEDICNIANQISSIWQATATIESIGLAMGENSKIGKAVYKVGCYLYEGIGTIYGPLYYGSKNVEARNLGEKDFSVSRCGKIGTNYQDKVVGDFAQGLGDEGENIRTISQNPSRLKDALNAWKKDENGQWFPGIRNICGFVSCEYSTKFADGINRVTGGAILDYGEGAREVQDAVDKVSVNYLSYIGSSIRTDAVDVSPKSSIVMSVASVCIPGIFYNLDKYRQIQCEYIKCLKDMSIAGAPISICESKLVQSYCLALYGEASEVFGVVKLVKRLGEDISSIAVDALPNALKVVVDLTVCKKKNVDGQKALVIIMCDIPRAVYNTIDSVNQIKSIASYGKKENWKISGEVPDVCKEVMADDFVPKTAEQLEEEAAQTESEGSSGDSNMNDGTSTSTSTGTYVPGST